MFSLVAGGAFAIMMTIGLQPNRATLLVALFLLVFAGWFLIVSIRYIQLKYGKGFGLRGFVTVIWHDFRESIIFLFLIQIPLHFLLLSFLILPHLMDAVIAVSTPENEWFTGLIPLAFFINALFLAGWGVKKVIDKFTTSAVAK
jgi:hypothetical protein